MVDQWQLAVHWVAGGKKQTIEISTGPLMKERVEDRLKDRVEDRMRESRGGESRGQTEGRSRGGESRGQTEGQSRGGESRGLNEGCVPCPPAHQKAAKSSLRTRIFYSDNNQEMVDADTEYSERIQVTPDQQGSVLTLQDVRLPDEREFICQVNGLAAGNAEGRTHLRVFGE